MIRITVIIEGPDDKQWALMNGIDPCAGDDESNAILIQCTIEDMARHLGESWRLTRENDRAEKDRNQLKLFEGEKDED